MFWKILQILTTEITIDTYGHVNAQFPIDPADIKAQTDSLPAEPASVDDCPADPDNAGIATIEGLLSDGGTIDALIDAIKAKTDQLYFTGGNIHSDPQTYVKLDTDGLDQVEVSEPSGSPSGWSFAQCLRWLIMRFFNKHTSDNFNGIVVHISDDTVSTSQPVTEVEGVKSVGKTQ